MWKKKRVFDYPEIVSWISDREISAKDLAEHCHISENLAFRLIDTLSINYLLWQPRRSKYKMNGHNKSAVAKYPKIKQRV